MKKLFLIFILLPIISGCWGYRELNDLVIVTAFAVEEKDNNIHLTAQIMNVKKNQGQGQQANQKFTIYESEGKTFYEALRKMTLQSPNKLYVSHVEVFIIDEAVAKKGIKEYLDYPLRETEMRTDFKILISKDSKASDILKTVDPIEAFSAKSIEVSLQSSSKYFGATKVINFTSFLKDYVEEGIENVIDGVYLSGNNKSSQNTNDLEESKQQSLITLGSIGAMKKDKLLGWLTEEESYGYNFITDNISSVILNLPCGTDKYIAVEILRSKGTLDTNYKDNKASGKVTINAIAQIGEVNCLIDLEDEKEVEKIKKDTEKHIKDIINKTIKNVQEKYDSDIFGFGRNLRKKDLKQWNKISKKWDYIFKNMDIKVDVSINLENKGASTNTLK